MRILLLFLFLGLSLFASIGKISALNGKVVIDRQKQLLDANLGFDLEEKDLVLTDDKSKAQITLNDGTVLSLGKNSKLNISEYVFDEKDSSNSKAEFKFVEGTFKSITGAIGKVAPEKFKLETKSASIGIRGTIVVGNQEKVACTQGQIAVTSAGVTQVLGAGMMTNTEIGKPPTPPTKIEGNLLKEVDNVGSKEESKSTTTESSANNKSNETKSESQSQQSSTVQTTTTQNNNPIVNLTTLTDVVKTANNATTQTSSDTTTATTEAKKKADEEAALAAAAEAKKKAEAIDAATILSSQATTIAQSVATASTNASSASTSTSSIAQGSTDTQITTAVATATTASTSASTLSSQAQTLKTEITTLLVQSQNASASEAVVIYEQIKTKSNSLNTISSQVTDALTTVQNSLRTVSTNLSNNIITQTSNITQNVSLLATNASTLTTTVTQMVQTSNITGDTQTALNNATAASASVSQLFIQSQALSNELLSLSEQLKTANSDAIVNLYRTIQSKSNSLVDMNSQLTQTASVAQNNFKIVIVTLADLLNTQSIAVARNISSSSTNATASSALATQTAQNASVKAQTEATNAKNAALEAVTTANQLSAQAQVLLSELSILLEQAKNATAVEALAIYEQIKTSSNALSSLLSQATGASTIALNSSKAVVNIPFYSTSLNITSSDNGSVGSQSFSVSQNNTTVTIATFTTSSEMDPVLILLKKNNQGKYVIARDDDSWTVSPSYYNSILNLTLDQGEYMITVSTFPFSDTEAVNLINHGKNQSGTINIYITSSSILTFDSSIEKYSYITKYNNQAHINNPRYTNTKIEENNASFGILADSKVGTAIKIDNYGYFVTISDSFDNSKNVLLNSTEVDDGSSWGYWTNDSDNLYSIKNMQSVWVSGNKVTPASDYKATFTGQVIGSAKNASNTGYIKLDSNNLFQATIDIGMASITNSTIKFNDSFSNTWNGSFNTTGTTNVNTSGFSANITNNINSIQNIENSLNSLVSTPVSDSISGSLSGNYYGVNNQVKSIGGSFNMTQGASTANGVFKAKAGAQ